MKFPKKLTDWLIKNFLILMGKLKIKTKRLCKKI